MRIGILCHASYGGSAKIAVELAIQLASRHHDVHLFSLHKPYFCQNIDYRNLTFHELCHPEFSEQHHAELVLHWPVQVYQYFLNSLLSILEKKDFDVLHFHYAIPFAKLAVTVKEHFRTHPPLIVGTLHGTDVSLYHDNLIEGEKLRDILKRVDFLTTVSQSHATLSRETFALSKEPLVISNFVDLDQFYQLPISSALKNGEAYLILHVSNFRSVKNPLLMAQIFRAMTQHIPAHLWLVGDGPELKNVQEFFIENQLNHRVHYWGLQNVVSPFLARADLFLISSHYESFCLAALEAMASGVPILAPNVGGLSELVVDGQGGTLFPIDEPQRAAQEGIYILVDSYRHTQMCRQATARAAHFDARTIVPLYEKLYSFLAVAQ